MFRSEQQRIEPFYRPLHLLFGDATARWSVVRWSGSSSNHARFSAATDASFWWIIWEKIKKKLKWQCTFLFIFNNWFKLWLKVKQWNYDENYWNNISSAASFSTFFLSWMPKLKQFLIKSCLGWFSKIIESKSKKHLQKTNRQRPFHSKIFWKRIYWKNFSIFNLILKY